MLIKIQSEEISHTAVDVQIVNYHFMMRYLIAQPNLMWRAMFSPRAFPAALNPK